MGERDKAPDPLDFGFLHHALRLHGIVEESIVDGPGLRYVVFAQGCPHHCLGCHNPHSHDPSGGYTADARDLLTALSANPLLSGITLSGGEPFAQAAPLAWLAEAAHSLGKHVMTYSGYTLEQLQSTARHDRAVARLLAATDILVDGPYVQSQRDLTLLWRGSTNQRLWGIEKNI